MSSLLTQGISRSFSRFHRMGLSGIRAFENVASELNDAEILQQASEYREQFAQRGYSVPLAHRFVGLICEAVFRENSFRLHDCQLMAMISGNPGTILEMQTGEGKTVVTGSIAALQTLGNSSVHVSTTNDYLASRDLESMKPVFERLGLSNALLPEESNEVASQRAYQADIVYGPGYQFGFDYLRDQMYLRRDRPTALGRGTVGRIQGHDMFSDMLQTGEFNIAIVDEADSVMIDEALTPLIISMPSNGTEDHRAYRLAEKVANLLVEDEDFKIEMPGKHVVLTDAGNVTAHDAIASERNLTLVRPWRIYVTNALRARHEFERDVQFVVVDNEVQLVDANTGRIQPDRRWQDGLHQAIECRQRVPIQAGRDSTAQVTRQRFLQKYSGLIGLTGTATTAASEFDKTYGCRVKEIATNLPCLRERLATRFFGSVEAKLDAIAKDVAVRHQNGQPVLVGTRTIRESYLMRDAMQAHGLQPVLLNGVQDEEEAEIVGVAGVSGAITIATNMAGRGTDIKPDQPALDAGGLHVASVSVNDSARIDRQLAGRAARQGQPGSCQFFVSADDAVLVENNESLVKSIRKSAKKNGESRSFAPQLKKLQRNIEQRHQEQRQSMMRRDLWMDTVRESIEKD